MVFELKVGGKEVVWIDYSKMVKLDGETLVVNLPDRFIPIAYSDELIGFDYSRANVKTYGCEYNANEIVEEWHKLVEEDIPLSGVAEALVTAEIHQYIFQGFTPNVSPWMSLVKLVDLLETCRVVEGFEKKLNDEVKKELHGILKKTDFGRCDQKEYLRQAKKLFEAVTSKVSEFTIVRNLMCLNYKIRIPSPSERCDIEIGDTEAGIMVEVKSRNVPVITELLRRSKKEQEGEFFERIKMTPMSVKAMLYHASAYSNVEHAFVDQGARIVFVDVSKTFSGSLMFYSSKLLKMDLLFGHAVDKAIQLVKSGRDAVITYTRISGSAPGILALAFDRECVEIGNNIDRYKLELSKNTGEEIGSMDISQIIGEMSERVMENLQNLDNREIVQNFTNSFGLIRDFEKYCNDRYAESEILVEKLEVVHSSLEKAEPITKGEILPLIEENLAALRMMSGIEAQKERGIQMCERLVELLHIAISKIRWDAVSGEGR